MSTAVELRNAVTPEISLLFLWGYLCALPVKRHDLVGSDGGLRLRQSCVWPKYLSCTTLYGCVCGHAQNSGYRIWLHPDCKMVNLATIGGTRVSALLCMGILYYSVLHRITVYLCVIVLGSCMGICYLKWDPIQLL